MRTQTKPTHLHLLRGACRAKPARINPEAAIDAVDDLVGWAFGLAIRSVDSPDDRERIRCARRYVRKSLRGRPARRPIEDLMFTAGVLARVCESELRLPEGTIVRLFDELELPTDAVPRVIRQPTPWGGPVTRCPTPVPRTPEEEEAHWHSLWFDVRDQIDRGDHGYEDSVDDEDAATAPCMHCHPSARKAA
ncbi:MAG: hypothetical protein H6709_10565 [Kofleriaceae bacterium]|nr:hypothetical protein [Myxococcales bacterium]MCB9564115.1 hypothetical protein [Kofleriaceae bacterium]MCB9572517.1 hypothetical protein [Kofleriaceae bacterium]